MPGLRDSRLLFLTPLRRFDDGALLLLRSMAGAFLVWGVFDNLTSADRMREFQEFLASAGFVWPGFMAVLSVWAQLLVGNAFILGLATRWAGLVCAINFVVAIVMVDAAGGIRGMFPSACLVLIGLYLATHGAGRFSLDRRLASQP